VQQQEEALVVEGEWLHHLLGRYHLAKGSVHVPPEEGPIPMQLHYLCSGPNNSSRLACRSGCGFSKELQVGMPISMASKFTFEITSSNRLTPTHYVNHILLKD